MGGASCEPRDLLWTNSPALKYCGKLCACSAVTIGAVMSGKDSEGDRTPLRHTRQAWRAREEESRIVVRRLELVQGVRWYNACGAYEPWRGHLISRASLSNGPIYAKAPAAHATGARVSSGRFTSDRVIWLPDGVLPYSLDT